MNDMPWLVCIDLDGTILKNNGTDINDFNIKIIDKLILLGHKVCITTGRNKLATKPIFDYLNLKHLSVCAAGAHIVDFIKNEDKSIFYIQKEIMYELLNNTKFLSLINSVSIEYKDMLYVNSNISHVLEYIHAEFQEFYKVISIDKMVGIPAKSFFIDPKDNESVVEIEKILKQYPIFHSYTANVANYFETFSQKKLIEVNNAFSTKHFGIKYLRKYYNIKKENTICFGDSFNDYDMLLNEINSVSMKNAIPKLHKISKYVTSKTNEDGGVGYFLNEFFNLKIL